jgi:hypothetical protein
MHEPHPVLVPPTNPDVSIWRYMGLAKFLSRSPRTAFRANRHDGRCTITTFCLQKISAESEEFLLQSYSSFLRRFCRHPVAVGLLVVCFITVVPSITTSIFGGFTAGAKVNFTSDRGLIPVTLFGFGAFYYYFRMPTYFSAILTELRDNGVFASKISISLDLENVLVSRLAQDSRLRIAPFVLPIIWAVLAILLFPYYAARDTFWWQINPISYVFVVLSWMLMMAALSGLVISIAISGAALNSIFTKNKVIVHSLHPDKSGGFSPVGDFSFRLTIMALLTGIMVGVGVWQSIAVDNFRTDFPIFLLDGLAYLVIVPILFYLPIRGAHKAMAAYRDNLIKQTYAKYSVENRSKYDPQNEEILTDVKGAVEQMDVLKRLAVHESSYPVWPFGFRTRVGVFANAIFPLTCTLAGVVFDNILNH